MYFFPLIRVIVFVSHVLFYLKLELWLKLLGDAKCQLNARRPTGWIVETMNIIVLITLNIVQSNMN